MDDNDGTLLRDADDQLDRERQDGHSHVGTTPHFFDLRMINSTTRAGTGASPLAFSHENLFAQIAGATFERGRYHVRFYTQNGLLSREPTDTIADFFYYPSAGAIRDAEMNIVYYSSLIDGARKGDGGANHPQR